MSRKQYLEYLSYAVLACAVIWFVFRLTANRYGDSSTPSLSPWAVGDSIRGDTLQGAITAVGGSAIVFVLSPDCSFCIENLDKYRQLIATHVREQCDISTVALVNSNVDGSRIERLFKEEGIAVDTIIAETFSKLGTRYVPYHVLVDETQIVRRFDFGTWDDGDVDDWTCAGEV